MTGVLGNVVFFYIQEEMGEYVFTLMNSRLNQVQIFSKEDEHSWGRLMCCILQESKRVHYVAYRLKHPHLHQGCNLIIMFKEKKTLQEYEKILYECINKFMDDLSALRDDFSQAVTSCRRSRSSPSSPVMIE